MNQRVILISVGVFLVLAIIFYVRNQSGKSQKNSSSLPANQTNGVLSMTISSPAFSAGGAIPKIYSCDGQGINPPLDFSGVPAKAKSLALIMDDPDVPKNLKPDGLFVHWVVYNMPAATSAIPANSTPPGQQGLNGAGKPAYAAPCPPDREHRYFFKLFALDTAELEFYQPPTKDDLLSAMSGHIISQAELIGTYNRNK